MIIPITNFTTTVAAQQQQQQRRRLEVSGSIRKDDDNNDNNNSNEDSLGLNMILNMVPESNHQQNQNHLPYKLSPLINVSSLSNLIMLTETVTTPTTNTNIATLFTNATNSMISLNENDGKNEDQTIDIIAPQYDNNFIYGNRIYSSYDELELLSKNWQISIIILYTLTATMAFVGNIVAICVLIFGKRSSKELRIFLVNLSLSDIMMAIFSIPFTYLDFMLGRWIFAPSFCPVVQQMQMTCVFVSVYTLTAIGIDRYMAIIHPLFSQRYNRSFGPVVIVLIWISGLISGFFQWYNTEARPILVANETNYECKEISSDHSQNFTIIIFIITFALPMSILTFTYFSIGMKIFTHSTPGNADLARDRAQQSSKVKIMKMLFTIVILFVVCWLPLHILNLFIYFARDLLMDIYNSQVGFTIYVTIAFTAHWFSMANSFVNPIIYCFMSENFRADLHDLFPRCLQRINSAVSPSTISSTWSSTTLQQINTMGHLQRKRNIHHPHHHRSGRSSINYHSRNQQSASTTPNHTQSLKNYNYQHKHSLTNKSFDTMASNLCDNCDDSGNRCDNELCPHNFQSSTHNRSDRFYIQQNGCQCHEYCDSKQNLSPLTNNRNSIPMNFYNQQQQNNKPIRIRSTSLSPNGHSHFSINRPTSLSNSIKSLQSTSKISNAVKRKRKCIAKKNCDNAKDDSHSKTREGTKRRNLVWKFWISQMHNNSNDDNDEIYGVSDKKKQKQNRKLKKNGKRNCEKNAIKVGIKSEKEPEMQQQLSPSSSCICTGITPREIETGQQGDEDYMSNYDDGSIHNCCSGGGCVNVTAFNSNNDPNVETPKTTTLLPFSVKTTAKTRTTAPHQNQNNSYQCCAYYQTAPVVQLSETEASANISNTEYDSDDECHKPNGSPANVLNVGQSTNDCMVSPFLVTDPAKPLQHDQPQGPSNTDDENAELMEHLLPNDYYQLSNTDEDRKCVARSGSTTNCFKGQLNYSSITDCNQNSNHIDYNETCFILLNKNNNEPEEENNSAIKSSKA